MVPMVTREFPDTSVRTAIYTVLKMFPPYHLQYEGRYALTRRTQKKVHEVEKKCLRLEDINICFYYDVSVSISEIFDLIFLATQSISYQS